MTSGGGVGVNGGSMRPGGFLGAGQRLSRAMSRCVLEPRPPGKRWMVSGVGRRRRGSRSLASVRPLCPGSRVPPNCCSVFLTGGWPGESRTARHATQRGHGGAGAAGAAAGCGGELDARPALCRRPRPGPAGGCPTGPAPATAAYERQRAQRGPGWLGLDSSSTAAAAASSPSSSSSSSSMAEPSLCFLGAGLSFPPPRALQEGTKSPVRIMWKEAKGGFNPGMLMLKSVLLTTLAFCFLRKKCLVSFRGGCTGPQQSLLSPAAWTRASGKAQCLAAAHRPGFRMAQLVLHALGCLEFPAPPRIFNTVGDFLAVACGFHLFWVTQEDQGFGQEPKKPHSFALGW
ncbi:peptidyl-tRNA hydrolase isoform X1 [Pan paniscus]|uniref:peptidyl-tRNA hydrolase isoform X1 n=1 Tax=Pan paniscus TaxID=9597 RepID=UPI0030065205